MIFWVYTVLLLGGTLWISWEPLPADAKVLYRLQLRPWANRLFRVVGVFNYTAAALVVIVSAPGLPSTDIRSVIIASGFPAAIATIGLLFRTMGHRLNAIFADDGVYYAGRAVKRASIS